MNRRYFVKMLGALGISAALPLRMAGSGFAATMPKLPVPDILSAGADGRIAIKIMEGTTQWRGTPTRTWGYNGFLLGPTLSMRRGQKIIMEVTNSLPEMTTVHWHGLEIPGTSDGGPQAMIEPGKVWKSELVIKQPAATCWYHPHPHRVTGRHVAMGLGGMLLIEDGDIWGLPLPHAWGEDDIPVIIQEKRLDNSNQIDYTIDEITAAVGWFGDLPLTNGVLYPEHAAPRGWLRLRLLNGCNARTLRLTCGDNRPMYVIAGDGGLLAEPVKLTELTIYAGERFEVLVDARDGKPFDLQSLPFRQIGMTLPPFDNALPLLRVTPFGKDGQGNLPDTLVKLPPAPAADGLPVRRFKLSMDHRLDMQGMMSLIRKYGDKAMAGMGMNGHGMQGMMQGQGGMQGMMQGQGGMQGMMGGGGGMGSRMGGTSPGGPFDIWRSNFINERAFEMNRADFSVKQGQYERWIISGVGDMMLHPFHVHGTQFRILKENGAAPEPHRQGFKDTTFVKGGESELIVRFMHSAPKERMYMAHCHLLEHEDTGMMAGFTVAP